METQEKVKLNPLIDPRKMPLRLHDLPIAANGYPIPYFVAYLEDGTPEFRAADPVKWASCVRYSLCWICGAKLGVRLVFGLGPMCTVTRTTSEPPMHIECARWSAMNCPFLARPHMHRREDRLPEGLACPGEMLDRNPGVLALWITRGFKIFHDHYGRKLLSVEDPIEPVEWWREGRPATREEVLVSLEDGMPALERIAQQDGPKGMVELARQHRQALKYLP
jgi:hypothetical protein